MSFGVVPDCELRNFHLRRLEALRDHRLMTVAIVFSRALNGMHAANTARYDRLRPQDDAEEIDHA